MSAGQTTLGARLKALRRGRQLTQEEVVEPLGVSQSALSGWENGVITPRPDQLERLAPIIGGDLTELLQLRERALSAAAGSDHAAEATGLYSLHEQALAHVQAVRPENLSVWLLGATNLSFMEGSWVGDRWCEYLLQGIDYHVVWMLDLVSEERLQTALTLLSEIQAKVYERFEGKSGNGAFHHYATCGFDAPSEVLVAQYAQFAAELAAARPPAGLKAAEALPYRSGLAGEAPKPFSDAVKGLLRNWHHDTGVVLYHPKSARHRVAANIRIMPVTQRIVYPLSPDAEQPKHWFWLSPSGAARLNAAVAAFENAIRQSAA